jgi:hypothetical protein
MRSMHTAAACRPRTTSRSTGRENLKFAALKYATSWFRPSSAQQLSVRPCPGETTIARFYADLVAAHPHGAAPQAPRPRHFHDVSAAHVMKLGPLVSDPKRKNPRRSRGSRSGARGTRTPDLLGAIQALSQLSYSPVAGPW